jgi:hypothetical protein
MVMDLGQDADTGWVHEHHSCLDCGAEVRERPRANKTETVLTVADILARKQAHLDRTLVWSPEDGAFRAS